jgi:glycosyltransferase involved in cell wall biosynthesis
MNPYLNIGYLIQTGCPDMKSLSGPQLHISHTIRALAELGHKVRIIAIQNNNIVMSDDLENWAEARLGLTQNIWFRLIERFLRRIQSEFNLPFIGFFDSLRFADACYHELAAADILYERFGWMGYGGVIAARWLRIPLVSELNGNIKENEILELHLSPMQAKISQWLTNKTFKLTDSLVVVSQSLRGFIRDDFDIPGEKINVVINGADLALFTQSYNEYTTREKYNIKTIHVITYVGSFQPWHGVDILISSYKPVLQQFPNSTLILIGDGMLKEKIEKQITELGLEVNIKMLGRLPQSEVAAVLSISDVAVIPYPYEHDDVVGTPLKLIEYMAAGKAIVASTMPIHEIIDDMETGLRVPPANVEALSDAVCRLLADPKLRSKLGKNAQQRSINYSWENVGKSVENILLSLIPS